MSSISQARPSLTLKIVETQFNEHNGYASLRAPMKSLSLIAVRQEWGVEAMLDFCLETSWYSNLIQMVKTGERRDTSFVMVNVLLLHQASLPHHLSLNCRLHYLL